MEKIEDVIELLEAVKKFRVNDELPFNTVDYMQIDSAIEFLSRLTTHAADVGNAHGSYYLVEDNDEMYGTGPHRLQRSQRG
jgi:hypothetical protein